MADVKTKLLFLPCLAIAVYFIYDHTTDLRRKPKAATLVEFADSSVSTEEIQDVLREWRKTSIKNLVLAVVLLLSLFIPVVSSFHYDLRLMRCNIRA